MEYINDLVVKVYKTQLITRSAKGHGFINASSILFLVNNVKRVHGRTKIYKGR